MPRTKSSSAWLARHVKDPYVHKARVDGYRSRSAYKLIEIAERDRLLRPGMAVVDLGAAPGGWSQVLAERAGPGGRVVSVDLLEVKPIPGVAVIRGDFGEQAVLEALEAALDGRPPDLVVSDMAPNLSGVAATDQARSIHLCELALDFAGPRLKREGALLLKVFQGSGYLRFLSAMRAAFGEVVSRKPGASRDSSSEMYLLGRRPRSAAGR